MPLFLYDYSYNLIQKHQYRYYQMYIDRYHDHSL
nr:MAG TPA: hypothetical protein [Bacteriophage sp.]